MKLNIEYKPGNKPSPWVNLGINDVRGVVFDEHYNAQTFDEVRIAAVFHLLDDEEKRDLLVDLWELCKPETFITITVPHGANDMAFVEGYRPLFPGSFFTYKGWQPKGFRMFVDKAKSMVQATFDPHGRPDIESLNDLATHARNIIDFMEVTLERTDSFVEPKDKSTSIEYILWDSTSENTH